MQAIGEFLLNVLLVVGAVSLAGTVALYFFWFYTRNLDSEDKALPGATNGVLNPLVAVPAILLEAASFAVLALTYPLRLVHDVMPFRAQARGETPILLVHGWGANSACFLAIQLRLKLRGHQNVYGVSYTPPVIRAEKLAAQLATHVEAALAATGAQKVHIVAHSMGGLLARYAIRHLGLDTKVDTVITLGSPHLGSLIANIIPGGGNVPQMRYRSKFVMALAEGGMTPGTGVRYYSIYSEFDNFVLPNHSAVLDGDARNIHVAYHGHCALLYSPVVFGLIEDCLANSASASAGAP